MINLAGDQKCDSYIMDELCRARILPEPSGPHNGEVPYTLIGRLGPFEFRRAWYYWVVEGPVPLDAAEYMYEHPEGKSTVRVAGHCGCPAPQGWVTWYTDDGREILDKARMDKERETYKKDSSIIKILDEMLSSGKYLISGNLELDGKPYVTTYHIDSQAGLLLFAETVYNRKLHTEPTLQHIACSMRSRRI